MPPTRSQLKKHAALDGSHLSDRASTTVEKQKRVLSFNSVCKQFGPVIANDNVSFEIESGSIHAIVGENGAGKSTLSKILSGYYRPDKGAIYLNGTEVVLNSPTQARQLGIGMVHQQLALVPSLTGFENVLLGDPGLPFAFHKKEIEKKVMLRARELGFDFDLSSPVSNLGIAERQKLEIFKLLWRDTQILILDEPTSQLTPFEAEEVLTIAENLAAAGRIVILITHHINEVMKFAKRVTVLRKGKCIKTVDTAKFNSDDLAKLMVDSNAFIPTAVPQGLSGASLFRLENVCTKATAKHKALSNINLEVCAGEVVGVAGISGSGQAELGMLIAGLLELSSGIIFGAANERSRSLKDLACYVPGEQKLAYAPGLSVAANSFIRSVNRPGAHTLGFVKSSLMRQQAQQIIESFVITPSLCDVAANALSGGNLQRLIIGRELSTSAKIVVADNPCAGLDAAMSMRIRHELRQAASAGRGVVLISPDLEELIATCDRIVVMFNGSINGVQQADQFNYQSLAMFMGGKPELSLINGSKA